MAALAAWRCGSSAVTTVTGPTGTRCQASLTNSSNAFGPSGGTGTLAVSIDRECSWSATSPVSWIQLTSAPNGQGDGSVSYRVVANPDPVVRHSAITAADAQAAIAQDAAPCQYSLSGPAAALAAAGGSATIDLRTNPACGWSAKPNSAWVTVAPASGSGNATLTVTAAPNTGAARTVTIAIGSDSVDVQQQAAPADPAPVPAPAPAPPGPTPPPPPPPPTTVDLEGTVSDVSGKCPNVQFSLDETTVQATRATRFSGGGCKDVKNDAHVEVRGSVSDAMVTADFISIKKGHH